jgi:hypothetical protein
MLNNIDASFRKPRSGCPEPMTTVHTISTPGDHGFRVRAFGAPRNDG